MIAQTSLEINSRSTPKNVIKRSVTISIVTWNSAGDIRDCLQPLADLPENCEVWVADNDSSDETVEIIRREFPFVRLIANKENLGFAAANNQIILQADTDYVLLLNPDSEMTAAELAKAVEVIEQNPHIGLLGVQLRNDDGTVQTTCDHFPTPWINFLENIGLYRLFSAKWREEKMAGEYFDHQKARRVDWLKGAFMLARREAVEKAGGVPEDYFMFTEDMDWCHRIAKNGFEVWFSPAAVAVHKKNRSAGQLPSVWRLEKSNLGKYLFCFRNYGALATRFVQITDLIGFTLGIWRLALRQPEPVASIEWKMFRESAWKALRMNEREIEAKLKIKN